MAGDPRECRRQAMCCAELAMGARSPQLAMMLTNLSRDWMKLALDLERTQALTKEHPPEVEIKKQA
jgi:hypothetical protein